MLLLLALGACTGKTPSGETGDDSGYAWHDTSPVVETGDSAADTGDSAAETGRPDSADSGDTGLPADPYAALAVSPAALVVNPGASFHLRVVGTRPDGGREDAAGVAFTSDDPAVATVDPDGTVHAAAAGETAVRAAVGAVEAVATVTVQDDLQLRVTVVDASTGLPVPGARVALAGTAPVTADAAGLATLAVADGGGQTVSAWVDEAWSATTVVGVVGRAVVLPIRARDADAAEVEGTVSFAGVPDPAWDELGLGLVGATVPGSLATLDLDAMFGGDRTVTVLGADVGVPANVVIEGSAEGFAAPAVPGPVGVWCFAGPLPIADVSGAAGSTGEALALFVDHLADLAWGMAAGGVAAPGAPAGLDVAPALSPDRVVRLAVPALPLGFRGTEATLVFTAEETVEGWVVTGLGSGSGTVDVRGVDGSAVAGSLGAGALAYAQVDGLGSGGATVATWAELAADGRATFPAHPGVAALDGWDPATRALAVTVDADTDLVRVRLVDNHRNVREVFLPASWSGTLPNTLADFAHARADVDIVALSTLDGSYEEWVGGGVLDPAALPVTTLAHTRQE